MSIEDLICPCCGPLPLGGPVEVGTSAPCKNLTVFISRSRLPEFHNTNSGRFHSEWLPLFLSANETCSDKTYFISGKGLRLTSYENNHSGQILSRKCPAGPSQLNPLSYRCCRCCVVSFVDFVAFCAVCAVLWRLWRFWRL